MRAGIVAKAGIDAEAGKQRADSKELSADITVQSGAANDRHPG